MEAGVWDLWNPGEAFVPECPLCSGKVARDDPAAQALDWGVRTAEAKGEESGFWKVAEAADIYGRWTGGARAAADILTSHVESIAVAAVEVWGAGANVLVSAGNGIPVFGDPLFEEGPESDEIEGEQNGEENGEEGGSDEEEVKKPLTLEDLELELETGSRIRGWPKVPGDEGTTRGVGPGPGPGEAKPTCCIDHFRYPATWFRFSEGAGEIAGSASSHQKVGIALNSEMQFNNTRGTCNCLCCEFKQWVKFPEHSKPHEDCRYYDSAQKKWRSIGDYGADGPPKNEMFVCPGDRPMEDEKPGLREEGAGTTWTSDCIVEFEDEPGARLRKADFTKEFVKYEADYWGVIIDTCQNNIVVDWARMKIKFESKGGAFEWDAEWEGDLTKEPVTFQRIAEHDDVPVEKKEKPTQYRKTNAASSGALPPPHQWLK